MLFVFVATVLPAQDPPATPPPPEVPEHYGQDKGVKVVFDPRVVLTKSILRQIVHSPAVEDQAIRDVNGKKLAGRLDEEDYLLLNGEKVYARVEFTLDDEQQIVMQNGMAFGTLHAYATRQRGAERRGEMAEYQTLTDRYHEAVRKRFEEALDDVAKREFAKHLDRERRLVNEEVESAERALKQVADKRERLRQIAAGLPQNVLEESVSNLQKQEQTLELDLAGFEARTAALQEQIKQATEEIKKAAPDDEVIKNLERVFELRREQLARLRQLHKSGTVSGAEIDTAEVESAVAQVELAQAKRQAGKGASDRLEKLTGELAQLAASRTESEGKRNYLKKRLAETYNQLQNEINRAQPLREEIAAEAAAAQQLAIEAAKRKAELRRLEASFQPASVEVFNLRTIDEKSAEPEKSERR
jgi:chromosome segregation ATPase